jgi:hypothetical protein
MMALLGLSVRNAVTVLRMPEKTHADIFPFLGDGHQNHYRLNERLLF